MFSNKVGIKIEPNTRLGAVATAFDGKRSAHALLRYKDGVLYTKPLSKTAFLAALGHKPSREKLREQSDAAMKQLARMVDARWGEGAAARIGLDSWGLQADGSVRVLSGHTMADLNMHAIAADALQALGCMENASVADRDAALQTIKGYMNDALSVDPDIGKAARAGAFRFALLQHYQRLAEGSDVGARLPRNPEQRAQQDTRALLASVRYPDLNADTLSLAQKALSAKGNCDPETLFEVELLGKLAKADPLQARALLRQELATEVKGISNVATAFRGNSAIALVMSARALSDEMKALVNQMSATMAPSEMREHIAGLDKKDPSHKNQLAQLVQAPLTQALQQVPPERLPLAFCQDVRLGLEVIEQAALQPGIDKEKLKTAWFANAFALRLLSPVIATQGQDPASGHNDPASVALSVGVQKLVNDPALNADYLAYMQAVAARGHTAAAA